VSDGWITNEIPTYDGYSSKGKVLCLVCLTRELWLVLLQRDGCCFTASTSLLNRDQGSGVY